MILVISNLNIFMTLERACGTYEVRNTGEGQFYMPPQDCPSSHVKDALARIVRSATNLDDLIIDAPKPIVFFDRITGFFRRDLAEYIGIAMHLARTEMSLAALKTTAEFCENGADLGPCLRCPNYTISEAATVDPENIATVDRYVESYVTLTARNSGFRV